MPLFDEKQLREARVVLMPDGKFAWGIAEFEKDDDDRHWVTDDARYETADEAEVAMRERLQGVVKRGPSEVA